MNKIFKFGFALLASVVTVGGMTSCDDWTDTESVDLNYGTPETTDPATYAKYLEALREYRKTDHKLVYAWFGNPTSDQVTNTRAERISALPDSIDFVVFNNPNDLHQQTIADMKKAREEKGMGFTTLIDFDAINLAYLAHVATATEENPFDKDFLEFLTDTTAYCLGNAVKNGFDGVIIGYTGKTLSHMTGTELKEYKERENVYIGIMNDWRARHPEMRIDFMGNPQNVANQELINDCQVIFLSESTSSTSVFGFGMAISMASVEGVPTDRFGMVTSFTDPNDDKVGYMADGSLCVTSLANWASGEANVKACGFTNIVYDYYNALHTYPVVREAIQSLNPSNL